jgi:ankyrin repeat protein
MNQQRLFNAIRACRHREIRDLVAADPSLLLAYDAQSFGSTPLTLAISCGDRESVDILLDLKMDANRASDWWAGPWTPLHCAIHKGDQELAQHLLDRGAVLDVHAAASLNRLDDLRRMLDESPQRISERGGDGCMPLHFAGSIAAAEVLLERGADIEARDIDHYSTPVQYLALHRPEVARYLFSQGAQADIFSAVLADDVSVVKTLAAADPQVVNERLNQQRFPHSDEHDAHNILTFVVGEDATPLHAAAKGNRAVMVDVLVSLGADVDGRGGYDDAAPLHIAAWENHPEVAERLIANGADINLHSGALHNNSPAGWAIVAGSDRVFQVLMDHGAERLAWFAEDARAALNGEFLKFKAVPRENYDRIQTRLASAGDGSPPAGLARQD